MLFPDNSLIPSAEDSVLTNGVNTQALLGYNKINWNWLQN